MSERHTGLLVIAAGVAIVIVGLLIWSGGLNWFGRLPGDVRIERPGVRVYFPITSMILVSIVLSLILAVVRRFF
ncbi:MAG TPA: DUF2905 domain-containing protein [Gemmatimonadales bacterium]|nr:DUF2905 domain-containing protein [Gemmatimonadales bacterium]